MWMRYFLTPFLIVLFAHTTPAGIFKKNTPKPDPAKYVPELIATLKGDKDDDKRAHAASELREYDPKTFPDLLPALVDALQNDPSSSVRTEAVNSLSKLRPITQQAGYALEQALANDSSIRVRVAARTTLWQFHLLGYRSGKPTESGDGQSKEPPIATPKPATPAPTVTPQPTRVPHPLVSQSKQSPAPTTKGPPVQPPLMPVPPALAPAKTNPLAKPITNSIPPAKPATNPIPLANQSSEPPLAQPLPTKAPLSAKPIETPKVQPKLALPGTPPSLVESPPKGESVPKVEKPPVTPSKPAEVKTEAEGPILTPPKD
jgi:hypothetical protein